MEQLQNHQQKAPPKPLNPQPHHLPSKQHLNPPYIQPPSSKDTSSECSSPSLNGSSNYSIDTAILLNSSTATIEHIELAHPHVETNQDADICTKELEQVVLPKVDFWNEDDHQFYKQSLYNTPMGKGKHKQCTGVQVVNDNITRSRQDLISDLDHGKINHLWLDSQHGRALKSLEKIMETPSPSSVNKKVPLDLTISSKRLSWVPIKEKISQRKKQMRKSNNYTGKFSQSHCEYFNIARLNPLPILDRTIKRLNDDVAKTIKKIEDSR